MNNYLSLKILDKLKFIFLFFNINYSQLRKILQLKFTIDSRNAPGIIRNSKYNKRNKNLFKYSLLFYLLYGGLLSIFILIISPLFLFLLIYYTIIIFLLTLTLMSDFSTILLNVEEKHILGSKPIKKKTINISKAVHITIYVSAIVFAYTLPAMILAPFKYGLIFIPVFIFSNILLTIFVILLTIFFYNLILKYFNKDKVNKIIENLQVALPIFIIVGYQIFIRMFDLLPENFTIKIKWFSYLIPSYWNAALFEIFVKNNVSMEFINLSVLAVVIPIFGLIYYIKFIAPNFDRHLSKLSGTIKSKNNSTFLKKIKEKLLKIFIPNQIQRSFYKFAKNMLKNEKKFKIATYPSIGFSLIIPFLFMDIFEYKSITNFIQEIQNGKDFLLLYLPATLLSVSISNIQKSERYKASWIYKSMPIKNVNNIFKGIIKLFYLKYVFIFLLIPSIFFLLVLKSNIFIHILIIFLISIFLTQFFIQFPTQNLPFSKKFENAQNSASSKQLQILFSIFAVTIVGFLHLFFYNNYLIILSYLLCLIILNFIIYKKIDGITWNDLK